MIDTFIVRPVLRLTTWVKRHPWQTLLVLAVIFWLLPRFFDALRKLLDVVEKFLPASQSERIIKQARDVIASLESEPSKLILPLAVLTLFAPVLGFFVTFWALSNKWKAPPEPGPVTFEPGHGQGGNQPETLPDLGQVPWNWFSGWAGRKSI